MPRGRETGVQTDRSPPPRAPRQLARALTGGIEEVEFGEGGVSQGGNPPEDDQELVTRGSAATVLALARRADTQSPDPASPARSSSVVHSVGWVDVSPIRSPTSGEKDASGLRGGRLLPTSMDGALDEHALRYERPLMSSPAETRHPRQSRASSRLGRSSGSAADVLSWPESPGPLGLLDGRLRPVRSSATTKFLPVDIPQAPPLKFDDLVVQRLARSSYRTNVAGWHGQPGM